MPMVQNTEYKVRLIRSKGTWTTRITRICAIFVLAIDKNGNGAPTSDSIQQLEIVRACRRKTIFHYTSIAVIRLPSYYFVRLDSWRRSESVVGISVCPKDFVLVCVLDGFGVYAPVAASNILQPLRKRFVFCVFVQLLSNTLVNLLVLRFLRLLFIMIPIHEKKMVVFGQTILVQIHVVPIAYWGTLVRVQIKINLVVSTSSKHEFLDVLCRGVFGKRHDDVSPQVRVVLVCGTNPFILRIEGGSVFGVCMGGEPKDIGSSTWGLVAGCHYELDEVGF